MAKVWDRGLETMREIRARARDACIVWMNLAAVGEAPTRLGGVVSVQ